jgi:hypothetical protein
MSEPNAASPSEGLSPAPSNLPENWAAMSADDKYRHLAANWSSTDGKSFESPEIAEKYRRLAQRWLDVVALKEPDEVPCLMMADGIILKNAGNKPVDAFYHSEKVVNATFKFHEDYDLSYLSMGPPMSGKALDLLGYKLIRWPGSTLASGLPEEMQFQYVEDEYMRADEYDQVIANPEGYMLRTYMPRVCDGLKGLEMMPSLYNIVEAPNVVPMLMPLAGGPVREAIDTLFKAADQAVADVGQHMTAAMNIMGKFGTPNTLEASLMRLMTSSATPCAAPGI